MMERKELNDDGTIDDVVGEGYWHLEQMRDDEYTLVTDNHVFVFTVEDGSIKVSAEGNQQ